MVIRRVPVCRVPHGRVPAASRGRSTRRSGPVRARRALAAEHWPQSTGSPSQTTAPRRPGVRSADGRAGKRPRRGAAPVGQSTRRGHEGIGHRSRQAGYVRRPFGRTSARLFHGGVPPANLSGQVARPVWGRSSVGRASRSQREGRGFDSLRLHHPTSSRGHPSSRERRCTARLLLGIGRRGPTAQGAGARGSEGRRF